MTKTLFALLAAATVALAAVPSGAGAHAGHAHVAAQPPKSKAPFKVHKGHKQRRAAGRSGAGWPKHAAQQDCTIVNGVVEAEADALRAGIFYNWTTNPTSYSNIVTVLDQYVSSATGRAPMTPTATSAGAPATGCGSRERLAYAAEALIDGRWTDTIYAPTWNLPFAVGTYIGGSSFIRLPAARQTRLFYSEWWWQSTDGSHSAGPHWDTWGNSNWC